jgi:putative spermidine/putrescine transport system ATP-binding protein
MSPFVGVHGVAKTYGGSTVLEEVALEMRRGEFVALLGPSGCGKTTLLRIVAGLVAPDRGTVRIDGRDVTGLPAHRRNLGVVFQSYALFPHLSVAENVAFGLRVRGASGAERRNRVAECLALVRMEALADRSVRGLSGGQQQRVALARALAIRPDVLLLDEPLAALDRKLREAVQVELRQLLRRLGITSIFVTHDQDEALVLADRIGVMQAGRMIQLSTPAELYERPGSRFVLDFVGRSCLLAGRVASDGPDGVTIDTAYGPVRSPRRFRPGTRVDVGLRPERLTLGMTDRAGTNHLTLGVADRIFLGSRVLVTFDARAGDRLQAELDPPLERLQPGERVTVAWPVADTYVFPAGDADTSPESLVSTAAAPYVPSDPTPSEHR